MTVDPRFLVDPFEPAYMALLESGELARRVERALDELSCCRACPRDCEVDRTSDETGICHTGRHAVVSSAFPHPGEESVLRGTRGSGTIFFSHCNLKCVFCQNADISQGGTGREATAEEVAAVMLRLQDLGCHNVNFVTPEHVVPQVIESLAIAAERGLRLPVVYNTSAYDSLSSLKLLDGLVDVYMPDFKFWDPESAHRYAKARDYPERARAALLEMQRQVGVLKVGEDGCARRGVLVRHLVMPGQVGESRAILEWLATELSPDTFVNVMGQYRPAHHVGAGTADGHTRYAEIDRRPTSTELTEAVAAALDAGLWRLDDR